MTDETPLGRIITFYSYKGGVGRSFALADVAVLLASAGHRVLCVDWDLEAPGLSRYFQRWVPEGPHDGLLEAILAFETVPGATAAERHLVVEHPKTEGRLHLLPSGRMDADYVQAVQKLSWDDLYAKGFGAWLEDLRDAWQWRYDFILIDARTGLSDTGGICTVELPHVLVLFTTPNDQSVEGTTRVIDAALSAHAALDRDRPALRVLPVATRIDDSEFERTEKWMSRMSEAFSPYLAAWSAEPAVDADRAFRSLAVPYVPYWSYGEELPVDRDHEGDPRSVLAAHRRLALVATTDSWPDDSKIYTKDENRSEIKQAMLISTNDLNGAASGLANGALKDLAFTPKPAPYGRKKSEWLRIQFESCDVVFVLIGRGEAPNELKASYLIHEESVENATPIIPIYFVKPTETSRGMNWLSEYQGFELQGSPTDMILSLIKFIRSNLRSTENLP